MRMSACAADEATGALQSSHAFTSLHGPCTEACPCYPGLHGLGDAPLLPLLLKHGVPAGYVEQQVGLVFKTVEAWWGKWGGWRRLTVAAWRSHGNEGPGSFAAEHGLPAATVVNEVVAHAVHAVHAAAKPRTLACGPIAA